MKVTVEFEIKTIPEVEGHRIKNTEPWETYWGHNMVWFLREYGWDNISLENIKSVRVKP